MGKNKTVQSVASDSAVSVFISWLIAQLAGYLPFLAWPGVGWILGLVLTPLLQNIINILLTQLNIDIIKLVVEQQKEAYEAAVAKLGQALDNPTATDAERKAAELQFKKDFEALIHSGIKLARSVRRTTLFV